MAEDRTYTSKLLLVGLSHHTAPLELLEKIRLSDIVLDTFLWDLAAMDGIHGALVVATCNRLEVYADADDRADYTQTVREALVRHLDTASEQVSSRLYRRQGADAVRHLFVVASSLDSMVIGEDQILAQLKAALGRAQRLGCASRELQQVTQAALRVGKRVRTDTDLNRAGRSMATVGLSYVTRRHGSLTGASALVIGAGVMGSVVVSALRRAGIGQLHIANRTVGHAQRLATRWDGRAVTLQDVPSLLAQVDVVITCTGATGVLLTTADVAAGVQQRSSGHPLFILDLAVPRDVDPGCALLDNVELVDVPRIAAGGHDDVAAFALAEAYEIVDTAVTDFLAARSIARIAPTLTAMRATASAALQAELDTLTRRVPGLDAAAHQEISRSVQRVLAKLLHQPTVRAKQLASSPNGSLYVDVLDELFTPPGYDASVSTSPEGRAPQPRNNDRALR